MPNNRMGVSKALIGNQNIEHDWIEIQPLEAVVGEPGMKSGLVAAGAAVNLQDFLAANSTEEERIQVQNTPISSTTAFKAADLGDVIMIRPTLCTKLGKDGNGNDKNCIGTAVVVPVESSPLQTMKCQGGKGTSIRVSKARKTTSPPRISKQRPTGPPPGFRQWISHGSQQVSHGRSTCPPPGFEGSSQGSHASSTCSPWDMPGPSYRIDRLPGTDCIEEIQLGPLWDVRDSNNEQLAFDFPGWETFTAKELLEIKEKYDQEKKNATKKRE